MRLLDSDDVEMSDIIENRLCISCGMGYFEKKHFCLFAHAAQVNMSPQGRLPNAAQGQHSIIQA